MFLRTFIATIVFLGTLSTENAMAYKSEGVDRINPKNIIKQANKAGLTIPAKERAVKKELQKLKRTNPKEFEKKLAQGLENSTQFQGYLLEIKEGLQNVEDAKKIAKMTLFSKIESDWKIIKTSALNTRVDPTFKVFKGKLKSDLEEMSFVKVENGYVFQVGQWGYVTVSKNLKNVNWRVEFNSKYDKNQLEEGALDIQIQEDSEPIESESDTTQEQAPQQEAPPEERSQFEE